MNKITKAIREKIAKDLTKNRFQKPVLELFEQRSVLALAVYKDFYSTKDRATMEALPDGWLPTDTTISVRFGSSYTSLPFDGHITGPLYAASGGVPDVRRLIRSRDLHICAKGYDALSPMTLEYDRLAGVAKDLTRQIGEAEKSALAAVGQFTTLEKLVAEWPEVEPFARPYMVDRPLLPAIRTSELNAILGLPVDEVAA